MRNWFSSNEFPAGSIYQVGIFSAGMQAILRGRIAAIRKIKSTWTRRQLLRLLKVEKQRQVAAHIAGNQEVFADMFVSSLTQPLRNSRI
jgi:hypothetical protein